jgi:hypothetical protein
MDTFASQNKADFRSIARLSTFRRVLSRKRIYGKSVCDILLAYSLTKLQETNMNTFIDRQLTQIKVQEMLQEAAEARADRKTRMARPNQTAQKFRSTFITALPVALWLLWIFVKG